MRHAPSLFPLALTLTVVATAGGSAHALDARSLGLGGSTLAAGEGAPGALANPASLMAMQRRGEHKHVSVGLGGAARDPAGLIDIASEDANQDLLDDIEREFEAIDLRQVDCDVRTATDETPCLEGLGELSALSGRALDIGNTVDGETPHAFGTGEIGLAFTEHTYPFALHMTTRVTGRGRLELADDDRTYLGTVETTLADGVLTYGEILDMAEFSVDEEGNLNVEQPEATLQSRGRGGYVARVTLGASLAHTVDVRGLALDLGLTPKLSSFVLAQGLETSVAAEFDDTTAPLADRFEDSETSGSSFTFDVGLSTRPASLPVTLAAVLRNAVPESIETSGGVSFDTTPQLAIGGAAERGPFAFNADLALNEAKLDGRPTQVFALGVEFTHGAFAARAGLNHEAAREGLPTALSLGLGLGPVDLAFRAAEFENAYGALQLSLTF